MANSRFILTPDAANLVLGNAARFVVSPAPQYRPSLAFVADTNQFATWTMIAPQGLLGTLQAVISYYMDTATTGTVEWRVEIEAISDAEAMTESFDSVNSAGATTVPGSAGVMDQVTISLTYKDSVLAGELLRIRVSRNAVSDTATGDARLLTVELQDS